MLIDGRGGSDAESFPLWGSMMVRFVSRKYIGSRLTALEAMSKRENISSKFAVCIRSEDPDLLTPRMIYRVLPDENAAKSDYVRIVDNEGEDYLYPAAYFIRRSASGDRTRFAAGSVNPSKA
jgi:hypothetical protein